MNNIFNIKRFGLVFRKDMLENWKRYLLLFITMLGMITIVITWTSFENYNKDHYRPDLNYTLLKILLLMFGAFGLLFSSTFMNPMNSKIKRMAYLINPSSNLEKYLSRWVIVTAGYVISFFIALLIADILRIGMCSVRYSEANVTFLDLTKLIYMGNSWSYSGYIFNKELFIITTATYLLFQSLFILGSTFWEKSTFIKTFTAGALILLSYALICRWTILLIYGNFDNFGNALWSLENVSINHNDISKERGMILVSSVISVFTLINLTLAYFRFRESEIIKRL